MASMFWDCEEADFERIALPEIDGTLLMELLEDTSVEDTEDERLGCFMRSLEEELGHSGGTTSGVELIENHENCEDCGLEDIISDLDSHDCSSLVNYVAEDPFDWVEMEVVVEPQGGGMGGWYVDEGRMMGFGDPRDYPAYYYGESCMEQEYTSLWQ